MRPLLRQGGLSPIVGAVLVIGIFTGLIVTVYSSYSRAASRNEEVETLTSLLQTFLKAKGEIERMENGKTFSLSFKLDVGGKTRGSLWAKTPSAQWTRRIAITIHGYHPPDYQIRIVIPRAVGMKEDYGDLRFLEDEEEGLLPYWIESRTSSNVTVWVRRFKPNDGKDNIIYVYYGNPSATDASKGEATFLLFEDFNGATLNADKWTWHNPADAFSYSISDGEFRIWTVSKGHYVTDKCRAGITCANVFPQDIVVEKKYRFVSAYREGTQFSLNDDNMVDIGGRVGSGVCYVVDDSFAAMWYATDSSSQGIELLGTLSPNTYYIHQLRISTGFYIQSSYLGLDRNLLLMSGEDQVTYLSWENLERFVGVSVWHDGSEDPTNNDFYVDWILIRKWVSPEPTVSFGLPQEIKWGEWVGRVGFTSNGLEIGDLSLVLEGGGLIKITGEGAEMLSPPVLLKVSEVREENRIRWLKIEVRRFVFEDSNFQLVSNTPVSLRFTCIYDLYTVVPENGRPNREKVVLNLENWVFSESREAWRKYLEFLSSFLPPYYGASLDPSYLILTVKGFQANPAVKDILYYERETKIKVEVV